jgi:hypothetical protein
MYRLCLVNERLGFMCQPRGASMDTSRLQVAVSIHATYTLSESGRIADIPAVIAVQAGELFKPRYCRHSLKSSVR